MVILDIQLNAVSVVNLVMSIGIAVEFCVHIAHAFLVSIYPNCSISLRLFLIYNLVLKGHLPLVGWGWVYSTSCSCAGINASLYTWCLSSYSPTPWCL